MKVSTIFNRREWIFLEHRIFSISVSNKTITAKLFNNLDNNDDTLIIKNDKK